MTKNDGNLLKKRFVYSRSIRATRQHWDLVILSNLYYLEVKNERQKLFCQEKIEKLRQEIKANKDKVFVFSTEGLTWRLDFDKTKSIKALNDILKNLGFDDIKIILYLRNQADLMVSLSSENIKNYPGFYVSDLLPSQFFRTPRTFDFKNIIQKYAEIFSKENIIVRLFDKNEFKDGDLLKDFIDAIGLEWDDNFIIPKNQNESLDLIGYELGKRINFHFENDVTRNSYGVQMFKSPLYFSSKDKALKFMPKKEHYQIWNDYFEEGNEWVRKEFFPCKERLFPKKDLSDYKENYELKEIKPEYWDRIAKFIVDFAINRKNIINDRDKLILQKSQDLQEQDQIIQSKTKELQKIQDLNNILNKTIQDKTIRLNQTQSKLSFQTQYGTVKSRIQNQLSYKLGQAMIVNSKSILGYIRMPFVLSYIKDKHKQEQKIYQEKIKK
ncbi:TPA: hypothetical protein RZH74_001573, partial [Campylobacter coli]|nr:hypothetical protein [Campylobacter coli]